MTVLDLYSNKYIPILT